MRLLTNLLLGAAALFCTQSALAQPGCMEPWGYVRSITVSNPSANPLTDFQVPLDFDSQALIAAGRMEADGRDIRITAGDCCTPLPVWIQSGINTASTRLWTRVPSIPANGSTTLRIYYGNPAAATVEHIDSVMFQIGNDLQGTNAQDANVTFNTKEYDFPINARTVRWRLYSGDAAMVSLRLTDANDQLIAASPVQPLPQMAAFSAFDWEGQVTQGGHPAFFSIDSLRIMNGCAQPCPGPCGNQATAPGDAPMFSTLAGTDCGSFPSLKVWYRRFNVADPTATLLNDEFQLDQPFALSLTGTASGCSDSPIAISVQDIGAVSYQWYQNGQAIPGATATSYSIAASGLYHCVADFGGCQHVLSDTLNATVGTPSVDLGPDRTLCADLPYTLDAGTAASYAWSNGATTQTIGVSLTGIYGVTITDAAGCTAMDTVALNLLPKPIANIVPSGPVQFCGGGSVTLSAFDPNFLAYLWSDGSTSSSLNVTTPGAYSVIVYAPNNCTDTSDVTNVTVFPLPALDLGPDTVLCTGDSLLIDAGTWNQVEWAWGQTLPTYLVTFEGVYVVTVTDANNCSAVDSIGVTYFAPPVITLGNDTTICANSAVNLSPGAFFAAYLWSNGATTPNIFPSNGTYTVTVTDGNGCTTVSPDITVDNFPAPTAPIATGDLSLLSANNLPNYQWYFNGNPIAGATLQNHTPTASGDYFVETADPFGCDTLRSNTITIQLINEVTLQDIPEGFSPNGDGINDAWVIDNLNFFPGNDMVIHNRWGQPVYSASPYTNTFDGKAANDDDLPDGTYFYILRLDQERAPLSGSIIINR